MLTSSFDPIAADYDAQFTHTATGRLQRSLVRDFLETKIQPGISVLELNCGTGEDAVWLAQKGCTVLATDLSSEMIARAAAKAQNAKQQSRVKTQVLDIRHIAQEFPAAHSGFDLVLSNFGGLNCLSPEELLLFGKSLPGLLRPGGLFIAVLMGRFCCWETLYFFLKGRPGQSLRRWNGGPILAPLGAGTYIQTWYYWPHRFGAFFTELDSLTVQPVGCWLPPSYLDPLFSRRPGLLKGLNFLEKKCRGRLWASAADHFMVCFEKRSYGQSAVSSNRTATND